MAAELVFDDVVRERDLTPKIVFNDTKGPKPMSGPGDCWTVDLSKYFKDYDVGYFIVPRKCAIMDAVVPIALKVPPGYVCHVYPTFGPPQVYVTSVDKLEFSFNAREARVKQLEITVVFIKTTPSVIEIARSS